MDNSTMQNKYPMPNNYSATGTYPRLNNYPMPPYSGMPANSGCGCGGASNPLMMTQNNGRNMQDCECNDYSLLTANTGVVKLTTGNPNRDGSGTVVTVLTAGMNGTIVRSITIKAAQAVHTGMVGLFIEKSGGTPRLYKEIQIPECPTLAAVPLPPPVLPLFEVKLMCELKLEAGMLLVASTQNTETINIIAEGLDWEYPHTLPDTCCNYIQKNRPYGY